jgi:type II secretory pathway component PulM
MSAAQELNEVAQVINEARAATAQGANLAARELVASAFPALNVQHMDFAVFRDGTMQLWLEGVPYIFSDFQRAALARGINRGEAP